MNLTPGRKTTEFLLTLGVSATSLALTFTGDIPGIAGVSISAGLTAIYTILRAALKAKVG